MPSGQLARRLDLDAVRSVAVVELGLTVLLAIIGFRGCIGLDFWQIGAGGSRSPCSA